jgi:hypothetical protein
VIGRRAIVALGAIGLLGGVAVMTVTPWVHGPVDVVVAAGVGGASWTPSRSATTIALSHDLVPDDAFVVETTVAWSRAQQRGLERYLDTGLRYTHEINDRSGRLSATGYWATNHPDPAFDRDDDDGDGRWEEAEITVGAILPTIDNPYDARIQFSRWHGKPRAERCGVAWDRRMGSLEVLSQLSRELFGEWQAERYTLTYDRLAYARVGDRPALPPDAVRPPCVEVPPSDAAQEGVVVTFAAPLSWEDALALAGPGRWLAFEAAATTPRDDRPWTCGGPVEARPGLAVCEGLGVRPDGVTAVAGYLDGPTLGALREDSRVARVDALRDPVMTLIGDLGGLDVDPPDLTVNDAWWAIAHQS